MFHLFSSLNQIHSPRFTRIIVDQTLAIRKKKLNVIMLFLNIFFIIQCEVALHFKIDNKWVFLEFEYKESTVAIYFDKFLANKLIYEFGRFGAFNYVGVKHFYGFDSFCFRAQAYILQKLSYHLNFRQLRRQHFNDCKLNIKD